MGVDPETKILIAPLRQMMEWARGHSLWPLTFGTACCAIEMMTVGSARYDTDRLGIFFRASPRQSDCMIVAGTINLKMAPRMKLLYEQMAAPKYVIAMGSCAVSGGPFADGYNVVNGVDQIVPVDIYLPGCPPRPEALINALLTLMERLNAGELSAAEKARIEAARRTRELELVSDRVQGPTGSESASGAAEEPVSESADRPAPSEQRS